MKIYGILFGIIFTSVLVFSANDAAAQTCPGNGQVINGSLNSVTGPFQSGRVFRDAVPSSCPAKTFPGVFAAGSPMNYSTHTFLAPSSTSCVTVNFNTGTCDTNVFAVAYLNSYNPLNLGENYIGDIGSSLTQSFSFEVPAGSSLVLVATSTNAPVTCDYSFSVDNYACNSNFTISLAPPTATNATGTQHTVTATVLDNLSPSVSNPVVFRVISGPNLGQASNSSGECSPIDCRTDTNGQVSWTYTGSAPGTDRITASISGLESIPVEKIWLVLPNPIPTLSEWGLIALAGIIGIAGVLMIHRRKTRLS